MAPRTPETLPEDPRASQLKSVARIIAENGHSFLISSNIERLSKVPFPVWDALSEIVRDDVTIIDGFIRLFSLTPKCKRVQSHAFWKDEFYFCIFEKLFCVDHDQMYL